MRPAPVVLLATLLILAGCTGGGATGELDRVWLSDTERDIDGNHHAVAAERIDGDGDPELLVPRDGWVARLSYEPPESG